MLCIHSKFCIVRATYKKWLCKQASFWFINQLIKSGSIDIYYHHKISKTPTLEFVAVANNVGEGAKGAIATINFLSLIWILQLVSRKLK